jgi:hypothetical protein
MSGTTKKRPAVLARRGRAAATSEGAKKRGRPPKPAEERAAVTVHVRFTAAEIDALDAYLAQRSTGVGVGASVTRTSLIRALLLAEIGLAPLRLKGGKPARKLAK